MNTHLTVDAIYMARAYLAQARTRRHFPAWHATLLRWAAGQRAAAMRERIGAAGEKQLFDHLVTSVYHRTWDDGRTDIGSGQAAGQASRAKRLYAEALMRAGRTHAEAWSCANAIQDRAKAHVMAAAAAKRQPVSGEQIELI